MSIAVETKNANYIKHSDEWSFIRDAIDGDRSIKAKKTEYVPKISELQSDKKYEAYLKRPSWDGFTQRVLNGKTGLIFAKAPTYEAPTQFEDLFENIDLKGATLTDFSQEVIEEIEGVGRVGGLVDMGREDTKNRPYFSLYKTETIINWKYESINNQYTLTMVTLQENEETWVNDFEVEDTIIYRVLFLKEGRYEQHIYRPKKDSNSKVTEYDIEIIVPLKNGKPLEYIPFVCATPKKLTIDAPKPPLLDLADKNLTLFKLDVEYYNALHWVGIPTPHATGVQPKEIEGFSVGGEVITAFSNPQAKLGMLQISAEGLQDLRDEKQSVTDTIVALGSNMLQSDKKVAEAENTVAIRSAGQNAITISTADTGARFITKMGEIAIDWMGISGEFEYHLNRDYNLTPMSPQLLKEVIVGKTLGFVTLEQMYEVYKKGEIPMGGAKTFEEWRTALEEEAPIISNSALPAKANNNDVSLEAIARSVGAK